jgi:excisionase family DNA binding protein
MNRLMTANEAATALSLSVWSVYEAARDGVIPCIRVGRRVRFDPEQLEVWKTAGGTTFDGGWRREPTTTPATPVRRRGRPREYRS